jgi:hypothetical protein
MQILGRGLFSYKNVKSHTDSQRKSQKSAASTELTQMRAVRICTIMCDGFSAARRMTQGQVVWRLFESLPCRLTQQA